MLEKVTLKGFPVFENQNETKSKENEGKRDQYKTKRPRTVLYKLLLDNQKAL